MMLMTDIHVRSFTGSQLKTYLHTIAKLRIAVFREYPYLQEADMLRETEYVRKIAAHKESIGVLIFDNTTLVGVSLGLPLNAEDPQIQQPFLDQEIPVNNYYFFSASVLLKPYRGRGIGHHFFDVRETHVQHYNKFSHICFCVPQRPMNDPKRPEDYQPLDDFWRKRGYIQSEDIQCHYRWTEIGKQHPEEKTMTFWVKELHSAQEIPFGLKSNELKKAMSSTSSAKEDG